MFKRFFQHLFPKRNLPVFSLEGWVARDGFWVEPLNRRLRFFINKPHHSDSDREQKWYAEGFRCDLPTHILRKLGYHDEPIKARLELRLEDWKEDDHE